MSERTGSIRERTRYVQRQQTRRKRISQLTNLHFVIHAIFYWSCWQIYVTTAGEEGVVSLGQV